MSVNGDRPPKVPGRDDPRPLPKRFYASVTVVPRGTGFAVPRDQYPIVQDVFDGLVIPTAEGTTYLVQIGHASPEVETQAALLETVGKVQRIAVELTEGCTMVSIVGHEYYLAGGRQPLR